MSFSPMWVSCMHSMPILFPYMWFAISQLFWVCSQSWMIWLNFYLIWYRIPPWNSWFFLATSSFSYLFCCNPFRAFLLCAFIFIYFADVVSHIFRVFSVWTVFTCYGHQMKGIEKTQATCVKREINVGLRISVTQFTTVGHIARLVGYALLELC